MQSYRDTALDFLGHYLVFLRGEEERSFRTLGGDPEDHALFPTSVLDDSEVMDRLHDFQKGILHARVPGELNEEQYTVATWTVETIPVFMWALRLWKSPDFFGQVTPLSVYHKTPTDPMFLKDLNLELRENQLTDYFLQSLMWLWRLDRVAANPELVNFRQLLADNNVSASGFYFHEDDLCITPDVPLLEELDIIESDQRIRVARERLYAIALVLGRLRPGDNLAMLAVNELKLMGLDFPCR